MIRRGEAFHVIWRIGQQQHSGTGILRNGQLSVVYHAQGEAPGVAVYTLNPNGSLTGLWTALGGQALGTETWTPKGGT